MNLKTNQQRKIDTDAAAFSKYHTFVNKGNYPVYFLEISSSRSDWGSNPRLTATPPSTKYQRSNPLSQIAILKKNGSLDSGIQA
jgi:hypothetical protein